MRTVRAIDMACTELKHVEPVETQTRTNLENLEKKERDKMALQFWSSIPGKEIIPPLIVPPPSPRNVRVPR